MGIWTRRRLEPRRGLPLVFSPEPVIANDVAKLGYKPPKVKKGQKAKKPTAKQLQIENLYPLSTSTT